MAADAGTRVAIACQGGGSHTAFTAGVLQHLLRHGSQEIVALSGTSGGAICALLTWYGLARSGRDEAAALLEEFWTDNSATGPFDLLQNDALVGLARIQDVVGLPTVSPYDYPEFARRELTRLLRKSVDFAQVARLQDDDDLPLLLVGAVDVRTGGHKLFSNRLPDKQGSTARARHAGRITLDAVLASAAVPPFFRAVHTEGTWFWDGLFSQNPPVRDLVDAPGPRPQELWVIRINPRTRAEEPTTVAEIADRRNELSGNLSLDQELYFIEKVNGWVRDHLLPEPYRTITIREIPLRDDLDLASKLDRDPRLIKRLMEQGRLAAEEFLA